MHVNLAVFSEEVPAAQGRVGLKALFMCKPLGQRLRADDLRIAPEQGRCAAGVGLGEPGRLPRGCSSAGGVGWEAGAVAARLVWLAAAQLPRPEFRFGMGRTGRKSVAAPTSSARAQPLCASETRATKTKTKTAA